MRVGGVGRVEGLCDPICFGFKAREGERREGKQLFIPIWGSRCMLPSVHIGLSAEILVRICEGS